MEYRKFIDSITPKENKWKNSIVAFISGGVMGVIAEILSSVFATDIMLIFFICIASIITGFGVFDDIVDKFKMGVIIPITGFAHSITAASLEYKNDGYITGIGSNYLKLAGSVILYGIVSAFIFLVIGGIIW